MEIFDINEAHAALAAFFEAHNAPRFDIKAYRQTCLELASDFNEALATIKVLKLQISGLQMEIKMMQEEMFSKVS